MATAFLVAAIFGGGILVIQVVLTVFGLGGDHDASHTGHLHPTHVAEGLDLLTVRGVAAGLAFFGLAGLVAMRAHWPAVLAVLAGGAAGFVGMIGVALAFRTMLRLESDGSVEMSNAIGQPATVYVPIPGDGTTPGRVLLAVQGRTLECDAVASGIHSEPLPTGTAVTVVDLRDGNLLEVVPTPNPLS